MVLQIAFHKVSSHLPRGLGHVASDSNIPYHQPTTFSSKPDCNSTGDVPSFILRTALSAIPFVCDLCGVDVQWFHDNSSQALPNFEELYAQITFVFPTAQETFVDSSPSPESAVFFTDMIGSIEWPNLAPRLHIDDCFEIHILHWELCDLLLSSHESSLLDVLHHQSVFFKEPLWSWSSCILRFFGLSGQKIWFHLGCSESDSREVLAGVSRDAKHNFIFLIFCELLKPFWQISQQVSLYRYGVLFFWFL